LNNDGSKRMKNVLNNDGDKVILLAPDQQAIASMLKIESEKSDFYGYNDKYDLSDSLNEQGLSTGITREDKSGLRRLVKSFQEAPEELKKRTNKDLVKTKVKKAPVKAAAKKSTKKPLQRKSTVTQNEVVKPPRSYAIGTPRAKPPPTINYVPGTPPTATSSRTAAMSNSRVEIIKPVSPPPSSKMPLAAKRIYISPSPWDPDVMVTPPNADDW